MTVQKPLTKRIFASGSYVALSYGASQLIRLASNLILARLLFPEAFGVMALVSMVIIALSLLSDLGISAAISQNERGDDPGFLNTAWTLQILRGGVLWLVACGLALPMSHFYDVPDLSLLLPVAGLNLLFAGFAPTRYETAFRHLQVGRAVSVDLLAQVIGIAAMIALAFALRSVWALVIGGLIDSALRPILGFWLLPGDPNRLRFERASVRFLLSFGSWITLSTALGFFTMQGDKLVFGKLLTTEQLGLYNIGFYLASFPLLLSQSVVNNIMIPAYRETLTAPAPADVARLKKVQIILCAGTTLALLCLAGLGNVIVDLLYDDRYRLSGAILVLVALTQVPQTIGMTYDRAALAAGNSKGFFLLTAFRTLCQFGLLLAGSLSFGLIGGLAGWALGGYLTYLGTAALAIRHKVWNPVIDTTVFAMGIILGLAILIWKWADVTELAMMMAG